MRYASTEATATATTMTPIIHDGNWFSISLTGGGSAKTSVRLRVIKYIAVLGADCLLAVTWILLYGSVIGECDVLLKGINRECYHSNRYISLDDHSYGVANSRGLIHTQHDSTTQKL